MEDDIEKMGQELAAMHTHYSRLADAAHNISHRELDKVKMAQAFKQILAPATLAWFIAVMYGLRRGKPWVDKVALNGAAALVVPGFGTDIYIQYKDGVQRAYFEQYAELRDIAASAKNALQKPGATADDWAEAVVNLREHTASIKLLDGVHYGCYP